MALDPIIPLESWEIEEIRRDSKEQWLMKLETCRIIVAGGEYGEKTLDLYLARLIARRGICLMSNPKKLKGRDPMAVARESARRQAAAVVALHESCTHESCRE